MKVVKFLWRWSGFMCGLAALGFVVMALAAPLGWPFELFASWPYLVATIGLTGAIILGMTGWGKLATATIAGSLIVAAIAIAAPGDLTRARAPSPKPDNQHLIWGNAMRQSDSVLALMARTADLPNPVLALAEIPSGWDWPALPARQSLNRVKAGDGLIGIGVEGCARERETYVTRSVRDGQERIRTYALKVKCPGYTLFAVHLTNPLWEWGQRFARRNRELEQLAAVVSAQKGPVVVIGDFNAPPSVTPFSRFMKQAGVDHTSCGGRWLPTWRPYGWRGKHGDGNPLTGIPIDHLFTRDIEVVSCTVGKDFGSDHLPLIVEFKPELGTTPP
jgi:endonuclease/exonuclease/phosphatase (EEP) superfamily protein YafD